MAEALRALAFYLPQFHPIPENDDWWGSGFTEWSNVAQGRPLVRGHYQPHLPADLGFYDLRLSEVREAQADMAAEAGLSGFIYYHYWFGGKRLLERPFEDVLASGRPDFPFALCWANENWTRRWDGGSTELLIGQRHSDDDDLAHIEHLASAFRDPRYIRVEGKPLLLVYRSTLLPDPARTTALWRARARELGLGDLFLVKVESFPEEATPPMLTGFDASVGWEPAWGTFGPPMRRKRLQRWARRLHLTEWAYRDNSFHDYEDLVRASLSRGTRDYLRFSCVTPSWDNTVRRQGGGALVLLNSSPETYQSWLHDVAVRTRRELPAGRQLVFINAWNEWAEGNHLEPDQRWGRAYLDATRAALRSAPS